MKKSFCLMIFVLALSFSAIAALPDSFKNLAGTKEEMDAMRLPMPETTGITSKSAMIPVRFSGGKLCPVYFYEPNV